MGEKNPGVLADSGVVKQWYIDNRGRPGQVILFEHVI